MHDRGKEVIAKSCTPGNTKVVFFQTKSIEMLRHPGEFAGRLGES